MWFFGYTWIYWKYGNWRCLIVLNVSEIWSGNERGESTWKPRDARDGDIGLRWLNIYILENTIELVFNKRCPTIKSWPSLELMGVWKTKGCSLWNHIEHRHMHQICTW